MTVSWNPDLLNRDLAPEIAQFTEALIPELIVEGEKVQDWMANHFLNSVFRAQFAGKKLQFVFNIIYRAQACFEGYEEARASTQRFLENGKPDNPPLHSGRLRGSELNR